METLNPKPWDYLERTWKLQFRDLGFRILSRCWGVWGLWVLRLSDLGVRVLRVQGKRLSGSLQGP